MVYSQTVAMEPIKVKIPRRDEEKPYLFGEKPWIIEWSTKAYYTEVFLELCFFDYFEDSTRYQSVRWREYHSIPALIDFDDPSSKKYLEPLTGHQLMIRIGGIMNPDEEVRYRTFERINIHFYTTDENVYTYNTTNLIRSIDQTGIQFNNIVNGMGLFGTRSRTSRWFVLGQRELDSLAKGQYTKDLGFVSW